MMKVVYYVHVYKNYMSAICKLRDGRIHCILLADGFSHGELLLFTPIIQFSSQVYFSSVHEVKMEQKMSGLQVHYQCNVV